MKRIYHILALMGLIFLFAAGGMAGFMFATKRLNAERIDQIAKVLRGEFPKPAVAASQPATQPASEPTLSRAEIARIQAQKEYFELVAERSRKEIEQRKALDQQIQLDVTRQMEEIDARRKDLRDDKKQAAQPAGVAGIEKELEWLNTMDPKKVKELLMQRKDPDAAQIMVRMDPSRIKKISDACKTADELSWIGRILNQIRNMDNVQAEGVEGPTASSK